MEWLLWMLAVVVLGAAALVAAGRFGGMPAQAVQDSPVPVLPDRPLIGDDLRQMRFAVRPRGYSMSQVDDLLDRLARELDGLPAASESAAQGACASGLEDSAIIEPHVSWQPGEEGKHGSNEAPHG